MATTVSYSASMRTRKTRTKMERCNESSDVRQLFFRYICRRNLIKRGF